MYRLRRLINVMLPVLATQLAIIGMNFFDATMSGHAGAEQLAGSSIGGSLMMPIIASSTGILMAATPIIAHLIGKNEKDEAVKIVSDKLILEGILDESTRCDTWTALAGHLQKRFMDENPETRIHYLLLMLDEADEIIKTSGDTEDSDRMKGRSDDMMILKGVNIFPIQIENILMQFRELGTDYLITLTNLEANDEMTVEVELNEFTDDYGFLQRLTKEITRQLKDEILITPRVKLVPKGSLPKQEGKAVRVKDLRKTLI